MTGIDADARVVLDGLQRAVRQAAQRALESHMNRQAPRRVHPDGRLSGEGERSGARDAELVPRGLDGVQRFGAGGADVTHMARQRVVQLRDRAFARFPREPQALQ
jgi:hypothetical protein